MSIDPSAPVTESEANRVFAGLSHFGHVILAVSGGADSMALMTLVADWRRRSNSLQPLVSAATVDHGLRAESRHEAELVAREARRLGLSHTILTWEGAKPQTGVPMAARDARYRLLEAHASRISAGNVAIVTAHHRDDQAETFAMRLARGAGIDGLSGMRSERRVSDGSKVTLVRPFLAIPKARLIATVIAGGIPFVDDPTNADHRYERARVRSRLPQLDTLGLSSQALAISARRLNDAREALDYAEHAFASSLDLSFGNEVFARFDRSAFESGPVFLRQKVMAGLIERYGGATPEPQLGEVEDLVARMQREGGSSTTLGGAVISSGTRFIRVWREEGRLEEREVELLPGESRVWDRRFVLSRPAEGLHVSGQISGPITVKPLGEKGYAAIVSRLMSARRPPARAALGLPSFWVRDELLAAPSLAPFALLHAPRLDPPGLELTALATARSC